MDISLVQEKAKRMKELVGLNSYPVGVKFSFTNKPINFLKGEKLNGYRYCQALMRARHGEHVLLDKEGISCPAAAAAFGFKPLPDGLKSGKGLMWFALAYLNVIGGRRIESSTAILQATCVDATLLPFKQNKMNLSYGCYGCRDATDIDPDESVLGFPFDKFENVSEYVEYLAAKAMPKSREKNAFTMLKKKNAEIIYETDVFETKEKGK